jgi:hypothetical protein
MPSDEFLNLTNMTLQHLAAVVGHKPPVANGSFRAGQ